MGEGGSGFCGGSKKKMKNKSSRHIGSTIKGVYDYDISAKYFLYQPRLYLSISLLIFIKLALDSVES